MELINENSNYYGYPKDKMWYAVQFSIVNPTSSPYTVDLFNGYNQVPIQTTPSPLTNPTILSGAIPVGIAPTDMIYNPLNNLIYVSNSGSNTVSVIDSYSNTVLQNISVGIDPRAISLNTLQNTVYVLCNGSSDIYVIDCDSNNVLGSPLSVPFGLLSDIEYCPINNFMYFSATLLGDIKVIDCSSNTIVSNISIGVGVTYISYNPVNNKMYISRVTTQSIVILECSNNTVFGSPIIVGATPEKALFVPSNNYMYVPNYNSDDISVINCASSLVVNTISLPIVPFIIPPFTIAYQRPFALAYNPLTNCIFVGCHDSSVVTDGSVAILDCNTNSFIGNPFNVSSGDTPSSIVFNSSSNIAYTSNFGYGSNDVSIIISSTSINPYISGTTNYNQFVRELQNIPKRVRHIRLTVESYSQMAVPLYLL
jgi:YVTN family beta-propeller protein